MIIKIVVEKSGVIRRMVEKEWWKRRQKKEDYTIKKGKR